MTDDTKEIVAALRNCDPEYEETIKVCDAAADLIERLYDALESSGIINRGLAQRIEELETALREQIETYEPLARSIVCTKARALLSQDGTPEGK